MSRHKKIMIRLTDEEYRELCEASIIAPQPQRRGPGRPADVPIVDFTRTAALIAAAAILAHKNE